MSEKLYEEAWIYTLNEIQKEYKNQGKEQDFILWFNMTYVSDTIDEITVAVASDFMKSQMHSKSVFKTVQDKIRKITGQNKITLNIIVNEAAIQETKEDEEPEKEIENKIEKKPVQKNKNATLREEMTFDNFIPGDNSNFAYRASIEVAKNPGHYKNPLFLYGGSGLGKTHLMQAIGNQVHEEKGESFKIFYTTAENLLNEFTSALNGKKADDFHKKYRNIDVFLLDDIQFLNGREGLQLQIFNIFESLQSKKSQMVFTCDRPIHEVKGMTDRLVSRLKSGLLVDLNPPDYETRIAIIQKKLEIQNKKINPAVIDYIAKNIETNVRELEGALNKVVEYADLMGEEVTLEIAQSQLKDLITSVSNESITVETIQKVICDNFQISISDIKSKKRDKKFSYPRQIAVYIAKELTELTYMEIGSEFGGKDHTTIIHAHEKIENQLKTDPHFQSKMQAYIKEIKDYKKS
ncbi:MAG: chromosomal replication initiator protein DnaA [Treponema sp.]|nr:chromosomal replication initiator protein DnaA [Treponema sp.]